MPPSPWISMGLVLSLAGSAVFAAPSVEAEPVPILLDYHCAGVALTEYQDLRVIVRTDGVAEVVVKRRTATSVLEVDRGILHLDGSDLVELRHLIRESGFFEAPERDPEARLHSSEHTLTAGMDGKQRTLRFSYRPRLQPLNNYLWRYFRQVEWIGRLERRRNSDGTLAVHFPRVTGPVAQPRALAEPLRRYIQESSDPKQLCDAFEALAKSLPAREWVEFFRTEMGKGDTRRAQILTAVPTWPLLGTIPHGHVRLLAPVIEELASSPLPAKERDAVQAALFLLHVALREGHEAD